MSEKQDPTVGSVVEYVDSEGQAHPALVRAVWPGEYGHEQPPGLNCCYVSTGADAEGCSAPEDNCGAPVLTVTSAVHESGQPAPRNFWRFPTER